ncbi:hypothetical protein SAMN05660964_01465 [Thiothrix caldifontis]|uniref:Uncharacterized protein n=1 Tax=Thiothrix caldifontis TaxID=525918 RepID=A0A1H4AS41_9GAMM|nr:hypothetical protein [Thiothrix caldifontis]SEA38699.1 hypothetical protein SAMN05660964_01465 [Thiothrix caldifontis]
MNHPAPKTLTWLRWLTLLLALTLLVVIKLPPMPSTSEVMSLQLASTPDAFCCILNQWEKDQQDAFADHFPLDFLFIAAYALSGYLWAGSSLFAGWPDALVALARWALPVAGVLDVGENVLEMYLLYLLKQLPDLPATVVMLAASCARLKWVLTGVFALVLMYALGRQCLRSPE